MTQFLKLKMSTVVVQCGDNHPRHIFRFTLLCQSQVSTLHLPFPILFLVDFFHCIHVREPTSFANAEKNHFQASFSFVGSPSPGQHLITLVTSGWEWVMCGCQVCSSRPTDKASSPVIATLPLPTCSAFGSAAQNFTHFAQFCV